MTAIYCYLSTDGRNAAMVSDDLEYTTKRRVDKIFLVDDRWAVAFYGQDLPDEAISVLNHFRDTTIAFTPNSTGELINQIALVSKSVGERVYPVYLDQIKRGIISDENWALVKANSLNMLVFDSLEFRLTNVSLGYPFPPERIILDPEPENSFEWGKVHRFALASKIIGGSKGTIDERLDLPSQLHKVLEDDRQINGAIGSPGAFYSKQGDNHRFISCYRDFQEYIENYYDPRLMTGFNLNVEVYDR